MESILKLILAYFNREPNLALVSEIKKVEIFEITGLTCICNETQLDRSYNLSEFIDMAFSKKDGFENLQADEVVPGKNSRSKKPQKRYALNKNKYLLDPELWRLENLLKKSFKEDPRDVLLINLALFTGGRAQEILNLERGDLNSYEQTIYIRGLKGSNDREIPIPKKLFEELIGYVDGFKDHHRIFPITYQRLRQIWTWYRPVPKKFHCLRHTFAIRLYQKTRDLRLVQVALGHRNITNTMVYADYIYSQQELKRLIL